MQIGAHPISQWRVQSTRKDWLPPHNLSRGWWIHVGANWAGIYLSIHLHLERKCQIFWLAVALLWSFRISAKKKKVGQLLNKLSTCHFHVSSSVTFLTFLPMRRMHELGKDDSDTIPSFIYERLFLLWDLGQERWLRCQNSHWSLFFLSYQKNKIQPRKLLHLRAISFHCFKCPPSLYFHCTWNFLCRECHSRLKKISDSTEEQDLPCGQLLERCDNPIFCQMPNVCC